jgi:hypothetical protein
MLRVKHNAGFFSCCSVRLHEIVKYFNKNKKLPNNVDSSVQFRNYKKDKQGDITFHYFKHYNKNKNFGYIKNIDYNHEKQFTDYKKLNYKKICPFVKKYFSPTKKILSIIDVMEKKYNITDYSNICVLFYRGNDKLRETKLCNYDDIIKKAEEILSENSNIKFLIQSDETEFIEKIKNVFPDNSFFFNDEIRHMTKRDSTVDKVFRNKNYQFSKFYLAITIIMSKCKYIVCGSGNCSIWIMLYRKNADNVYQFLQNRWV